MAFCSWWNVCVCVLVPGSVSVKAVGRSATESNGKEQTHWCGVCFTNLAHQIHDVQPK